MQRICDPMRLIISIRLPFLKNISNSGASDQELVALYKRTGDARVLSQLYQRYMDLAYGVCLKYLKEPESAKDAVLTIFEELLKKKTVTKDLATKADGRDTALKTEKTRREAELKKPNLSVADRDRTTVLLKQIDQAIVKNQDQKDEAIRQTKETEKAEAAIKPEIDLLGVTMQRAQKAVNDP